MDTSKTYIKMCGRAMEIQRWKMEHRLGRPLYTPSDFVFYGGLVNESLEELQRRKPFWTPFVDTGDYTDDFDNLKHWWLPRQDQLQEMLMKPHACKSGASIPVAFAWLLYNVVLKNVDDAEVYKGIKGYWSALESMEQLWLALVMKAVYKKVWDGEGWVNDN